MRDTDGLELETDIRLVAAKPSAAGPGYHFDRLHVGIGAKLFLKPLSPSPPAPDRKCAPGP